MSSALTAAGPDLRGLGRPRRGVRTPRTLASFIRTASARHQLALVTLSIVLFLADLAPLELQRRIVNATVLGGSARTILLLAALYGVVALAMGVLKLGLNVYRSYVSESAVRWLRHTLLRDLRDLHPAALPTVEGVEVSLVLAEVEPVGAFVGLSVSEPVLQGGIVAGTFTYMLYLNPLMAALALAVFAPQMVFVPLMQRAINRRVVLRTAILRRIGGGILETGQIVLPDPQRSRVNRVFDLNMGIFKLKFSMNFLMNLMHHAGVAGTLGLGGYLVVLGEAEIGTVVAFVAGLRQLNDPWGGLVDWFRDLRVTQAKYGLLRDALDALPEQAAS